jgi:hypothetical protein
MPWAELDVIQFDFNPLENRAERRRQPHFLVVTGHRFA